MEAESEDIVVDRGTGQTRQEPAEGLKYEFESPSEFRNGLEEEALNERNEPAENPESLDELREQLQEEQTLLL